VGSEGTLGIICGARLRVHPVPVHERRAAYAFGSFEDGLVAMRRVLQAGATPAVLRLYDAAEADRTYHTGERALLLVLDEGSVEAVDHTMGVIAEICVAAHREDPAHVEHWLERRNDVAALEALISRGYVVDTMEVAGRWRDLPRIYRATIDALLAVEGTIAATAHQSHSYTDGGCLYFTFAGKPEPDQRDAFYVALWDAGQRAVLANGGTLSHHHGVGVNRARFVRDALGGGHDVLTAVKQALDPRGILNPGKLGLASPFGEIGFPSA
jgi:alkyldihydroxyacetonephosphate synthase